MPTPVRMVTGFHFAATRERVLQPHEVQQIRIAVGDTREPPGNLETPSPTHVEFLVSDKNPFAALEDGQDVVRAGARSKQLVLTELKDMLSAIVDELVDAVNDDQVLRVIRAGRTDC